MPIDWPIFERSLAALALVENAGDAARRWSRGQRIGPGRRLGGGHATAMSIQFAPEPEPTANVIELGEDQATGPLPLGFEFEFFGVRYAWFNLTSRGFMNFSSYSSLCSSSAHSRSRFSSVSDDLSNFIALGWSALYRRGRKRVGYEIRGAVQRRRLVVSFTPLPGALGVGVQPITSQLVLYERTGMVDVHTRGEDAPGVAVRLTTSPNGVYARVLDSGAH